MFIEFCRGMEILSASECGFVEYVKLCGSYCLRAKLALLSLPIW